jgi:hypothetical protein
MPKGDAEFFQALICQVGENLGVNVVLGEALGVLGHAELFEPVGNLLHGGAPSPRALRCAMPGYLTNALT